MHSLSDTATSVLFYASIPNCTGFGSRVGVLREFLATCSGQVQLTPEPHNSGLISGHETCRNLHFALLLSTSFSLRFAFSLNPIPFLSFSLAAATFRTLAIKILSRSRTFLMSDCDIDLLVVLQ